MKGIFILFFTCFLAIPSMASECIWEKRIRFFYEPSAETVKIDAAHDQYILELEACEAMLEASNYRIKIGEGRNALCEGDYIVPMDRYGRILDYCKIKSINIYDFLIATKRVHTSVNTK